MINFIEERWQLTQVYCRLHWSILPLHSIQANRCTCGKPACSSAGKHPLIEGGCHSSSLDLRQIEEWWERWPWANVGISTGRASGFFAVDRDDRHFGDESLVELERRYGKLPTTVRSLTGGGGQHILFRTDGKAIANRCGVAAGIDIRGDGGFIVVPPSLHKSGVRYCWDVEAHPEDVEVASAPAWMNALMQKPEFSTTKTSREWLGLLEEGKRPGRRNDSLTRIVGHLLGRGVNIHIVCELILAWNQNNVQPPQSDDDVMRTIASVASAELRKNAFRRAAHE